MRTARDDECPSSCAIWRRSMRTRCASSRSPPVLVVDERHEPVADSSSSASTPTSEIGSARRWRRASRATRRGFACLRAWRAASHAPRRSRRAIAAMNRNGSFGRPGIEREAAERRRGHASARLRVRGSAWRRRCRGRCRDAARVTMMPAAVEISSAGICATRPSPIVSSVYCVRGLADAHAVLDHADDEAADDVDDDDDERRRSRRP